MSASAPVVELHHGTCVDNRFMVEKRIGGGSFGEYCMPQLTPLSLRHSLIATLGGALSGVLSAGPCGQRRAQRWALRCAQCLAVCSAVCSALGRG